MEPSTGWIEHLSNPLVLMGFVLVVLAGVFKLFKTDKLSGTATERLMNKMINFGFALGGLIVIFALVNALSTPKEETKSTTSKELNSTTAPIEQNNTAQESNTTAEVNTTAADQAVAQQTSGAKSPAITTGNNSNVNIRF